MAKPSKCLIEAKLTFPEQGHEPLQLFKSFGKAGVAESG